MHLHPRDYFEASEEWIWADPVPVRCAQSDSAALCLAAALKETAGFTDVSLSDLTLSPSAIRELTQTLAANKTVAQLALGGDNLCNEGAQLLAPVLRSGALASLDLKANAIGNGGAAALAEMLATNLNLRRLDLQRNHIKCQGAVALAAALQVNSGLQVLSLRFNEIADSGATALAKALQANTSVLEVHLGGNLIGAEGAVQPGTGKMHEPSSSSATDT